MKIYEFGAQHDRTFVMFPCAAEPWWVFRESAEAMARDLFGYNRKTHLAHIIAAFPVSALLAWICTLLQ